MPPADTTAAPSAAPPSPGAAGTATASALQRGIVYALIAYGTWGLFPLYLRVVGDVRPWELVLHRSAYALVVVCALLTWRRQWAWLPQSLRQPRELARFAASAGLLTVNWLVYVLAVQHGRVVEASLGYFINPLVSVLLGVVVLRERLARLQWAAVALAAAGVAWLTLHAGQAPWISLALAASFGLYGLMRKTARLGALEGLALENLLLAPLVLPALLWAAAVLPGGAWTRGDAALVGWLLLAGPLTAVPLLAFAAAARRLPLSVLGLLQYLSPTLQLVIGVALFGEPFGVERQIGFAAIWGALALVTLHAWRAAARATPPPGS